MKWALLILIFLFILYSLLSNLYSGKWDGKSRFTVVDLGPPVKVISFDPATGRGIRLLLPNDLEVDTSLGRGRFPAGSLTAAGSPSWASGSVASFLGIFYAGEISQLKLVDRLRWRWASRQVEWRTVDLDQAGMVQYRQTADGEKVGRLAPNWEQAAAEWFISLVISQEKLAVSVINTTPVSGLAASAARSIESSGIKVVEVANQTNEIAGCELVGPRNLHRSIGVKLMLKSFGCRWREGDRLTLFLGRDFSPR